MSENDIPARARELFGAGASCSQAVLTALCPITGLDEETAMRVSGGFGGGMGRMREVCGACTAMFMAAGLLYGYSEPGDGAAKAELYSRVRELAEAFRERFGTISCRELLEGTGADDSPRPEARTDGYYRRRPCADCVEFAARIFCGYAADHPADK